MTFYTSDPTPFPCPSCDTPNYFDLGNLGQSVDCKECGLKYHLVIKSHDDEPVLGSSGFELQGPRYIDDSVGWSSLDDLVPVPDETPPPSEPPSGNEVK